MRSPAAGAFATTIANKKIEQCFPISTEFSYQQKRYVLWDRLTVTACHRLSVVPCHHLSQTFCNASA